MDTLAGRDWYYDFREIDKTFSDDACAKVAARLLARFSSITKKWSVDLNSEWICRLYMAAKFIMSATLHINSARFASDSNLRVVIPYLRYYSVLSLLRAICHTLPEFEWEGGKIITLSHGKAINGAIDCLRRFDSAIANTVLIEIEKLKAERELISYRAPSSGDEQISERNRFLWLCTLLAEVAQFNSELLERSILKNADQATFQFLPEYAYPLANIEIDNYIFGDKEDAYRLHYFLRRPSYPTNLQFFMREGHVDDFFGAWNVKEDGAVGLFDPDEVKGIIFDIP